MIHGIGSWHQLLMYQFHHIKGFTPAPTHQELSFQFRHIQDSQGAKDSLKTKPGFTHKNLETKRKTTNHFGSFSENIVK